MKIGVISDTHGFLHPEVSEIFSGVNLIIHAGDIGGLAVWTALSAIAPVTAVKGNYDQEPELQDQLLPDPSPIVLAGLPVLLTHRLITMDWNLNKGLFAELFQQRMPGLRLVIFGHTHFPVWEQVAGLWFLNPGYAGPDRLEGPLTLARLEIEEEEIKGEIVQIGP
jgi:hypothetical protein